MCGPPRCLACMALTWRLEEACPFKTQAVHSLCLLESSQGSCGRCSRPRRGSTASCCLCVEAGVQVGRAAPPGAPERACSCPFQLLWVLQGPFALHPASHWHSGSVDLLRPLLQDPVRRLGCDLASHIKVLSHICRAPWPRQERVTASRHRMWAPLEPLFRPRGAECTVGRGPPSGS